MGSPGKHPKCWYTFVTFIWQFAFLFISSSLRSFGHQGALYYVFLASDPLKTLREYAVFTLRTRGPKVCTRETLRQTQRVSAFLFWLCQMIALLHKSRGKLAARTKFHNVLWKTKGLVRMVTSKILCKRQKWGRSRPKCIHIFALLVLNLA